jgi:hypothetical protein
VDSCGSAQGPLRAAMDIQMLSSEVRVKRKLNHRTGHEGPTGRRGRSLTFLQLWPYMTVCGQRQASAALTRERDPVPILPL